MGSRRTMPRSSSGNGRPSNGNDISGSSRPGGCSYLSNVRPENRNTLCSIIAQLTEETQPSFESTIKSRAVSENCNVKFSCVVTGHPVPQVMWYKDDVQLDRYCGLPKYEIFRNGANHSLHIYNCTTEDAAIYQASAINTKGIVSCSGVLEVGEMNEFKIHQRYFAKLKQKAENRRKEAEGKENQEPLRTISPDRTQRKRRSTMEAFLSTPSSTEDDVIEESHQAVAVETEARLQEVTVDEAMEKPVPLTNGALSALTNGQAIGENAKSVTHINDAAQKMFAPHQPRVPFVKKKIKISNSGKVAKSDTPREWPPEDRRAKDETPTSVALACTESLQLEGNSGEDMEVENIVGSSSLVDSAPRNGKECQKSEAKEASLVERRSKDGNVSLEVTKPSQKEQLTALLPAAVPTSTGHSVSGTKSRQPAKHLKEAKCTAAVKHLESQKQSPHRTSTRPQAGAAAAAQQAKKDITTTEGVTVTSVDEKSNTSSGASPAHRGSVNTPCESRTALSQHPCEQPGNQLPGKEMSPCQNNVSMSRAEPLSEVPQVHTKRSRTDAPVDLELPLNQCATDAQPPAKAPSETRTLTADMQTTSMSRGRRQAAIDRMTQDSWDHSRGSNETHMILFTDQQMSPLQSHVGGENTHGCNIYPSKQQSQLDRAIKTVGRTDKKVGAKVKGKEVGKLIVPSEDTGQNEKVVEMEIENAALHMIEHSGGEKTEDTADKDTGVILVDASNKDTEKNKLLLTIGEETDPASPLLTTTPENTKDFQEVNKPETKIISIAELLRSQIKALDSTLANSRTTLPFYADYVHEPNTNSTVASEHDDSNCELELKKSKPDRRFETSVDNTPRNIKETLMEIYYLLNKIDQEQSQIQAATSPPVQALQKPVVIPLISVVETDTTKESAKLHSSAKKSNERVIWQEIQTVNLVSTSEEPATLHAATPIKATTQDSNMTVLENAKGKPVPDKDTGLDQKLTCEEPGTLHAATPIRTTRQDSNITILENAKGKHVPDKDTGLDQKLTCEEPGTLHAATPIKTTRQDSNITVLENAKCEPIPDTGFDQKLTSEEPGILHAATPIKATSQDTIITILEHTEGEPVPDKDIGFDQKLKNEEPVTLHAAKPIKATTQDSNITVLENAKGERVPDTGFDQKLTSEEPGTLHAATPIKATSQDTIITILEHTEGEPVPDKDTGFDQKLKNEEPVTLHAAKPIKATTQDSNITILEHAKGEPVPDKDTGFDQKLSPEIKHGSPTTMGSTGTLSDQSKTEEHNQKNCCLQTTHKFPTKFELGTEAQQNYLQLQHDSSMAKEVSKTSPLLKKKNGTSPIPSATAQELASGARRKIMIPKAKPEDASEATSPVDNGTQKREISASPVTLCPSPSLSRQSPLLQPPVEQSPPAERHSPLVNRRKITSETRAPSQQPTEEMLTIKTEGKPAEKVKHDPFKAPQVIRKIRAETFADALGHLKLWCQFFNILSDSTIKWYRNDEGIAQIKRSAGDESQANLAIVQVSSKDCGVYRCTITNEYGTDSTDCLLSAEILGGMSVREDLGVGEEIEMTPMIFNKGVADSGAWGNKLFGRIMMQESQIGDGCLHKVWRAKVIYGLEPVFESGNTCIIKACNPITYGGKGESLLIDRNLETVKQECKIQNLAREYCKIFSAEARVNESFGPTLEVIPVYLMYRPANTVPYARVEADLKGDHQKYCVLDQTRTGSEVEQKCCALEHWIFQWTNGNLLLTQLEGFDTKITNVGLSVKSTGHQGLPIEGNPKLFEQFVSQHQCNYYCGLLGLRSLKVVDSLQTPTKPKGSKSPLLQRKMAGSSSSPQTGRKAAGSPRLARKTEQEGGMTPTKQKAADATKTAKTE